MDQRRRAADGPAAGPTRARRVLGLLPPNSLRTLPYVKAWHERYAGLGLRVIGVHSAGFEPSEDPDAVAAAVERLGVEYPVVVDVDHQVWQEYENVGWPARYLWTGDQFLFDYHYGEGAYAETELAIQELLGVARDPVAPIRPEDEPGAVLAPQSQDVPGAYSGPYEAGGVWACSPGAASRPSTASGSRFRTPAPTS